MIANLTQKRGVVKQLFLSVCCLFFFAQTLSGQPAETPPAVMFKQLSTTEGLSNNSVRSIYRDSRGFLWIGTESGLNKYDGYSFQQYYITNTELPDDAVNYIFEDPDGNIWVRTQNDYSIYDYRTGTFDCDYKQALERLNIPAKNILRINRKPEGEFWAYDTSKLYVRSMDNNSVKAFPLQPEKVANVSIGMQDIYVMYVNGTLHAINKRTSETREIDIPDPYRQPPGQRQPNLYVDRNDNLWIYNYRNDQLLHYNNVLQQWEDIDLHIDKHIQYNRIQHILDAGNGKLWILTSHSGLVILNTLNKRVTHLVHHPLKRHTIASNNLSCIHQDKDGTIWLGNFKHGISYYSPLSQIILSEKSFEYDDILTFCKDADREFVFYGTDGTGLIRQSLTTGCYEKINTPANIVVDLSMDQRERLWMGTYQKGLICYSRGNVKQYTTANSALLEDDVYTVKSDKHNHIWIGTLKGCIQRLDPESGKFETILNRPGEFFISDMYYDREDRLYVATSEGLIVVNTEKLTYNFHQEETRFKENKIVTVYKDSRGLIWMGHPNGLSIWNQEKNSVYHIDRKEGLAANLVRAIVEDNYGQMWIGTGNGISRIRLTEGTCSIVNYSVNDGLISNDTNTHAILRLENGHILVGTPKGYQTLIPQEILSADYCADIYLTNIELRTDKQVGNLLAGSSPECAHTLTFDEDSGPIMLSFSALNLPEADKTRYAYRIEPGNGNWIAADNNKISLSMLPAGSYTLSVKAHNPQGTWSPNIKQLKLKVLPPWWRTWWAYTAYVCVILGIGLFIVRYLRLRHQQKAILQSVEMENERQRKVSEMKLQFFANISHELRTPLSLIINPLEEFFEDHPEHRKGLLEMVKQNADYLLELINQLLDFRKLDAKAETLQCKHDNVLIILNEIFHSFDAIARKRNIGYTICCRQKSIFMDFDYDKLRKICTNLLSNAFKFTPARGNISLTVEVKDAMLELTFADSGCGIDDAQKEKVFQRFYQSDKNPSGGGGSGIGLHIVSEYVKMHQGNVRVEDNTPCGTRFIVTMPLHQPNAREEERYDEEAPEASSAPLSFTILLVDDNYDFLGFLSKSLAKHYRIVKAMNGKQALNMLESEDVDLIVSDIMMPEMDGLELCSFIKNDIRYSHIPVILLTAKASEEHLLEGLGTGADDYITKPFNMEVLKLRISKIIENNAGRRELFNRDIKIEPSRITITPLDRQLVEKAIQIVEENIDETEFSVEELASRLNISRSYFYKKLIKITGKKPIEFIRTIRMKRAQQLLAESQMQVSEIAYTLGYNSPKIFSKHFKEEFNISPSEFMRQQQQEEKREDEA